MKKLSMSPATRGPSPPGMTARRVATLIAAAVIIAAAFTPAGPVAAQTTITVGSKTFTESVVLGEIGVQLAESAGYPAQHRRELGGTRFLWNALLADDVDAYPEYTGTLVQEIFAGREVDADSLRPVLETEGIGMTEPLGFNNTYAIGMNREVADSLGIETISDLRDHPDLSPAFSNEFMDRADGWPGLRDAYEFPHGNARGMDHDLAYRGLEARSVDVTDLYATDAEIAYYDLKVLVDDLDFFPEYRAVFLYRLDVPRDVVAALEQLQGSISQNRMIELNARAKIERVPEQRIAADFLGQTMGLSSSRPENIPTRADRIWRHTKDHLFLVAISLAGAILLSIPLGVLAAKVAALEQIVLGIVGVIYTIPSLALLVFMIPLLGIGGPPAILALFLYSLLPIVRNTHAGLKGIPPHLLESADAIGLKPYAKLRLVELPLASRSILAGIKTSAVINIGTATLGALIGAGGYGQPILTGIRLDDMGLIFEGAIPAAVLALVAQGLFELAERLVVPKGLRLASE
ncbi:MAG: glycine betaine ABC transporter substrate-binding protein [Rhodothermales bacterium]